MWFFKRKPFLDPETAGWHLENFEWLVRCYASSKGLSGAKLVLPRPGFFTTDGEKGHAYAERIFEQVKAYAQIPDWPVRLIPGRPLRKAGRTLFEVMPQRGILGIFGMDEGNKATITYAPNLIDDPQALVATLAHEIGHYVIASAGEALICADDEIEFLTDLAAIYMGFGVFLANSAFRFQQWRDDALGTQGWDMRRNGYLPEPDLAFGLAIFLRAKEIDPAEARACLKPHLATMLDKALRDLDARADDIARIRNIERDAASMV